MSLKNALQTHGEDTVIGVNTWKSGKPLLQQILAISKRSLVKPIWSSKGKNSENGKRNNKSEHQSGDIDGKMASLRQCHIPVCTSKQIHFVNGICSENYWFIIKKYKFNHRILTQYCTQPYKYEHLLQFKVAQNSNTSAVFEMDKPKRLLCSLKQLFVARELIMHHPFSVLFQLILNLPKSCIQLWLKKKQPTHINNKKKTKPKLFHTDPYADKSCTQFVINWKDLKERLSRCQFATAIPPAAQQVAIKNYGTRGPFFFKFSHNLKICNM